MMIGRAFEGEIIGLQRSPEEDHGEFNVYLGHALIGTLNEHTPEDLSPARYAHVQAQRSRRRGKARSEDLAAAPLRSASSKSSHRKPTRNAKCVRDT
jgi:hypothetical protein